MPSNSPGGALLAQLAMSVAVSFVYGCGGSDGKDCVGDRDCESGQRCEQVQKSGNKQCVPCDANETPYDGVDNDCNSRTRDRDLDGDGENAKSAPNNPGTDCNDQDPLVNAAAPELCGDGVDNNCDGRIDEEECADRTGPSVRFLRPAANAIAAGTLEIEVQGMDDTRVETLTLIGPTGEELESKLSERAIFSVDTTTMPDGPVTFTIEAKDIADKTARANLTVVLDNHTPPSLVVLSPHAGESYSGNVDLSVDAIDSISAVRQVTLQVDARDPVVLDVAPYLYTLNTAELSEGAHTVFFTARDLFENESAQEINFNVDRTGPAITVNVTPLEGSAVRGLFTVTVEAMDPAGIGLISSTPGSLPPRETTATRLEYMVNSLQPSPRVPNGPFQISVVARDGTIRDGMASRGNTANRTVTVVVTNPPPEPVVRLVSPQDGFGVYRDTTIAVDVTSPVRNTIDRVEFRVNGRSLAALTAPPYTATYDFTDIVGTATVTVSALDSQGFRGFASAVVHTVPPPTFRTAALHYPMGGVGTGGLAVGDVTGDGVPDVVTGGGSLSVLTGTISALGQYRLLPPVVVSLTGAPWVRLANVAGDAALDIVAVSGTIDLFTNDGNGRFTASSSTPLVYTGPDGLPITLGVADMEVADIDRDGDIDVVVGLAAGADIAVFRRANGNFMAPDRVYGLTGQVSDIVIARLDGDVHLDVGIARNAAALISTYRNNGDGTFGSAQDSFSDASVSALVAGDVDGDGYPDMVGVLSNQNQVEIYRGVPSTPGTFSAGNAFTTGPMPSGVALADLNGDHRPDAVVTIANANTIEIYFNRGGSFMFDRSFIIARGPKTPVVMDLDGDDDQDVLVSSTTDNAVGFARGLGVDDFFAAPSQRLPQAPIGMAVANILGSPAPDLIMSASPDASQSPPAPPRVLLYENMPSGQFQRRINLDLPEAIASPKAVAVGDLDGRNGLDIAVGSDGISSAGSYTAGLFLSNGTGGFRSMTGVEGHRPVAVVIGDVDGDGVGEAVFTEDYGDLTLDDGAIVVKGSGTITHRLSEGRGAVSTAIADLNRDGSRDIAVANYDTGDISVSFWMRPIDPSSTGSFATTTFNALPQLSAITVGRVGADDINDIVGVGTQGVMVMEGLQGFGFRTPNAYPAGPSPTGLIGGDFNRDGLYDVLVLNPGSDQAHLLIANPQGGFFTPSPIVVGKTPSALAPGDFDGDGRDDVAIASTGSPSVMVIYSNSDQL